MLAVWCFSSIGLLMSLQYDLLRSEEENEKPSLREMEIRLDKENKELDRELATLLVEYKRLCEER